MFVLQQILSVTGSIYLKGKELQFFYFKNDQKSFLTQKKSMDLYFKINMEMYYQNK